MSSHALSADRVQERSVTTGLGPILLDGAVSQDLRAFASAFADGDLVSYVVLNLAQSAEWEKGIGTYSAAPAQIARTHVTGGSNDTSAVDFSVGEKLVLSVAPSASLGAAWSVDAVYAPGDTAQDAGTLWYALAVNVGSEPASTNANWVALGGDSSGAQVQADWNATEGAAQILNKPTIPTKTSELANDAGYLAQEIDPTVPAWAKQPQPPTYSAADVGLGNVDNTSDADKPVSTAQAVVLATKASIAGATGIAVVATLPGTPDANTIYMVTT